MNSQLKQRMSDIEYEIIGSAKKSRKLVIFKGGPGSGNFDHQGRPGEVGGSGEAVADDGLDHFTLDHNTIDYDVIDTAQEPGDYWILPDGQVVKCNIGHQMTAHKIMSANMGKTDYDGHIDSDIEPYTAMEKAGGVRIVITRASTELETGKIDRDHLRLIQYLVDNDKIKLGTRKVWWANTAQDYVMADPAELMMAKRVVGFGNTIQLKHKGKKNYVTVIFKGGPGSGNFDHEGRPGMVGGSSASNVVTANTVNEIQDSFGRKAYFIAPDGLLLDVYGSGYKGHAQYMNEHADEMGIDTEYTGQITDEDGWPTDPVARRRALEKVTENGYARVLIDEQGAVNIEMDIVNTKSLRKVQRWLDEDKIPHSKDMTLSSTLYMIDYIRASYDELLNAKAISGGRLKEKSKSRVIVLKGGPGSGNFDHAGRPGKQGGSGPGGLSSAEINWDDSDVKLVDEETIKGRIRLSVDGEVTESDLADYVQNQLPKAAKDWLAKGGQDEYEHIVTSAWTMSDLDDALDEVNIKEIQRSGDFITFKFTASIDFDLGSELLSRGNDSEAYGAAFESGPSGDYD